MSIHKPVLLKETIELLNLRKSDTVIDATLGGGGHAQAILKRIGINGKLVAIDLDKEAIEQFKFQIFPLRGIWQSQTNFKFQNNFQNSKFKIENSGNIFLVQENFAELEDILNEIGIKKVDAVLADLGWSSDQLSGRGMSFLKNEPLDMRFDLAQKLTAREIVNDYSQKDLERIIKNYGEDKFWKKIAKKIAESRKRNEIKTTIELAEIVKSARGYESKRINPATKTFQAIRIEVNKELEALEKFIPQAISALRSHGKLAIISFHSLEDRIVKNIFRENARGCICPETFPQCICGKSPLVKVITKKPITASQKEVCLNPRSRSAKLRVCEKM